MQANKILLQKKYARLIELFAEESRLPLQKVLNIFYDSEVYQEISEGISDMHCRSDQYLVEELIEEYKNNMDDSCGV